MDISKLFRWSTRSRQPLVENDSLLDLQIREALVDYVLAQPPAGAWERLVKTIADRGLIRGYGMWVLDEPLRDPPEAPPMWLDRGEHRRAERLYHDCCGNMLYRTRDIVLSGWFPTFSMIVNL